MFTFQNLFKSKSKKTIEREKEKTNINNISNIIASATITSNTSRSSFTNGNKFTTIPEKSSQPYFNIQKDLLAHKLKIKKKLSEKEGSQLSNIKELDRKNSTIANSFRTINTDKKAESKKQHVRYVSQNFTRENKVPLVYNKEVLLDKELCASKSTLTNLTTRGKEGFSKAATMISSQRSSMSSINPSAPVTRRGSENKLLTEISDRDQSAEETKREFKRRDIKSQTTTLFKRKMTKMPFGTGKTTKTVKKLSNTSLFSDLSSNMLPQVTQTESLRKSLKQNNNTIIPFSLDQNRNKHQPKLKKKNLIKAFRRNAYGFTSDLLKYQKIGNNSISKNKSKSRVRTSSEDIATGLDVKNLAMISKKMLSDLEKQLHLQPENEGPNLKSSVHVNKYLIRDFLIGEKTDAVASSKKKMKMTANYLRNKEESTKKRLQMIADRFEMMKDINHIEEDFDIPEAETIKVGSKFSVDKNKILEEFISTKKEHEKKIKDQVEENSKKLADMILDIDCSSYESIDYDDDDNFITKCVYPKNIERTIRLRNILKHRDDSENDNLGINNIEKFKEQRRINDNELIKALSKLGNPNFVKTKFRKSTIEKYKVVNGKYFGVMV